MSPLQERVAHRTANRMETFEVQMLRTPSSQSEFGLSVEAEKRAD